ncbi:capsular polysaccharide biosynthesis protein [Ramlibacter rhizophilus]|uniref:Capsular polysaccharide biosynthesis protein n=1 Tax=Ramlibacter rhizophilus TaxID=1781167 RepID=A0A4Z0BKS0_9BURK|nr:capsular polysaccharide biosynthesis protein [Ramlibacter rhizophilus]TFY99922.1 capsular polysaccharide biosynthesis protein [Ramlibacter rhizophilus]
MQQAPEVIAAGSTGIRSIPTLPALLGAPVVGIGALPASGAHRLLVAAWGRKPSAVRAEAYARKRGLSVVRLEDGFLRSYGTGGAFPPLSVTLDRLGIYYDSSRPSELEEHLQHAAIDQCGSARTAILQHRLSKYNHAPAAFARQDHGGRGKVLVVDQTLGDLSIELAGASRESFTAMLAAARAENPSATLYVKTHPEVSSGRKRGYLTHIQDDDRTVVIREAVNPLSLIEQMDRVYVVTSTMGFEALLAGKPVTCFGMPWYAGWGVTDDRQTCLRRTRKRSVDEIFAAAYLHYTRYLNPETHERGTIFDVIGWLVRQKAMADRLYAPERRRKIIGVGYRRWKAANLQPVLSLEPKNVTFVPDAHAAQALQPAAGDWLVYWGATAPAGVAELAARTGAECIRMEDGFIRSVGLGSDLIRPRSIALDRSGIYFDATRPSDLETMLQEAAFSEDDLCQARQAREFIVAQGLTKYNLEPRATPQWPGSAGRRVVLVPGQVEDDASIRLGCTTVRGNLTLLQAVRAARPDAYIVYKPHPDVASGNRAGRLALSQARALADHVETQVSVVSCIEACDELHTMSSLSGFDALLRGKHVVTYGQPFYAGWGLTEDRAENATAFARRTRRLTLDQLVAGALIRYPIYWDWTLKGYTSCMAVLRQIAAERDALEGSGGLEKLRSGWWRRQGRKLRILWSAWTARA